MSCPLPLILGLEGFSLSADERRFLKHANPLGFILFRWNIEDAAQVKALIQELKMLLSRAHLPILVDAEGGDVWRLNASFGDPFPHPRVFGDMFEEDPEKALSACCHNYFLIGKQHKSLGFTVNCAPLLDLVVKGADSVIGMRSFSSSPQAVAALGAAAIKGLLDAGMVATINTNITNLFKITLLSTGLIFN